MRRFALVGLLWVASSGAVAWAQTSTNINLTLKGTSGSTTLWENALTLAQTGSAGTLGYASLVFTSSSGGFNSSSNGFSGPTQITAELAFNEMDTIAIGFTYPTGEDLDSVATLNFSGGTVTGGTGAYAGASGSLDLTFVKDTAPAYWSTTTTTGSGSVIVGGKTIPVTLTNFRGWCCGWETRERDYFSYPVSVSGSLGNASGQVKLYSYLNAPTGVDGVVTIPFSSTDSLTLGYGYTPSGQSIAPPSSFTGNIVGGTGKYANAYGALNYTNVSGGLNVTGTMTLPSSGATITHVKTVYGWPWMAGNAWLEIHGTNLVPANTPAAGVDWSNAPEFANGQMPTQLGPVSVTFGGGSGLPGYVYFYCSAQTNPNCADDQINVLAPLLTMSDSFLMKLAVNNNAIPIAVTAPLRDGFSPAFLTFDAAGHIAARHLDASLVGPASLYPGSSTPAKAGETISLYAVGFSLTGGSTIVAGSATQSGSFTIPAGYCWVSGISVQAVPSALISPGLYQLNLTIPKGVPSGENPVECIENFYPTFPGAIITVQ